MDPLHSIYLIKYPSQEYYQEGTLIHKETYFPPSSYMTRTEHILANYTEYITHAEEERELRVKRECNKKMLLARKEKYFVCIHDIDIEEKYIVKS